MNINGSKLTLLQAGTAADAGLRVDDVRQLAVALDGTHRTGTCAKRTATTFLGVDEVLRQVAALMSRTAFLFHVCQILLREVVHRREYRVGRGLSQTAERGVFDH